jgi:hypothetical protein
MTEILALAIVPDPVPVRVEADPQCGVAGLVKHLQAVTSHDWRKELLNATWL